MLTAEHEAHLFFLSFPSFPGRAAAFLHLAGFTNSLLIKPLTLALCGFTSCVRTAAHPSVFMPRMSFLLPEVSPARCVIALLNCKLTLLCCCSCSKHSLRFLLSVFMTSSQRVCPHTRASCTPIHWSLCIISHENSSYQRFYSYVTLTESQPLRLR